MMESRFDMNNFERSLKEHADRFMIVPSERVWKGIYNDLHPGSKWPSLAMGLLMIITLFWMGNNQKSNTEDFSSTDIKTIESSDSENILVPNFSALSAKTFSIVKDQTPNSEDQDSKAVAPTQDSKVTAPTVTKQAVIAGEQSFNSAKQSYNTESEQNPDLSSVTTPGLLNRFVVPDNNNLINLRQHFNPAQKISKENMEIIILPVGEENINRQEINSKIPITNSQLPEPETGDLSETQNLQPSSKAVQQNTLKKKKKNEKIEWIYFVSPAISSVYFRGNNLNMPATLNSGIVINPTSKHQVIHSAKMGFEAGADVNYKLSEKAALTSGMHITYSGYNITSNFVHPSLTTVTFQDADGNLFVKNYMTQFGNGKGPGKFGISNYNLQFSIPVGLQWDLWGNDDIKVSVVSTIEPFLVLGSKAYILSGDGNNYVNDPDLIRKINLSGNFGSMISFEGAGVNWHIGPNVRYQILSTYHSIYPIKEHLINYGLKIGISKRE